MAKTFAFSFAPLAPTYAADCHRWHAAPVAGLDGDIIIFTGAARPYSTVPPVHQLPEYAAKYQPGFGRIGITTAQFAAACSVPLRVTPVSLRGH